MLLSLLDYLVFDLLSDKKEYYTLRSAKIQNPQIVKELEKECEEKDGILTYAEYLHIDQFGDHGYHSTHSKHGFQPAKKHWIDALLNLCKQENVQNIVDIGCGDGILGSTIAKEAKKRAIPLLWHGVEINKDIHKNIREHFAKADASDSISQIASTISDATQTPSSLLLFSFSLDSMPPIIFINASQKRSFPTGIVGIVIKNGILFERLLTDEEKQKKNISLKDGVLTMNKESFDLRSWQLDSDQRAYIGIDAFRILSESVKKFHPKVIVIIDEFHELPGEQTKKHHLLPCNLYTLFRVNNNLKKMYERSGKNLYYYLGYINTYASFLKELGFRSVQCDTEERLGNILAGTPIPKDKGDSYCAAIVAREYTQNDLSPMAICPPDELKKEFFA